MFAFLRGELIAASAEEAVLEVSGIGYRLHISSATFRRLPEPGSQVLLFSYLQVREDALQLFGFIEEEELKLFRLLVSISGVGPKLALAVLSGLQVREVQESIVSNQPEKLYGVTGIGKKTAARIILELRDKILKMPPASTGGMAVSGKERQLRDDAVQALITLGFQRTAVQKAVTDILDSSPSMTVEEVVKAVLASIRNS